MINYRDKSLIFFLSDLGANVRLNNQCKYKRKSWLGFCISVSHIAAQVKQTLLKKGLVQDGKEK